jgi:hypothetical protein
MQDRVSVRRIKAEKRWRFMTGRYDMKGLGNRQKTAS